MIAPSGFAVARFLGKADNLPQREEWDLDVMELELGMFKVRASKDGPLWSPTGYRAGATRASDCVVHLSCLVLDFDRGHDQGDIVAHWREMGLRAFVHSTFGHTEEHPKWRAVFPLARPVPAAEWEATHARLVRRLANGLTDPACKDAARIYYLPSCPPSSPRFALAVPGSLLDPEETLEDAELLAAAQGAGEDLDPAYERPQPRPRASGGGELPGDWLNRTAVWRDLLESAGGRYLGRTRDGREHYERSGKARRETSATTGNGRAGQDLLVVHSPNWSEIPKGCHTKFGLFAHLRHGGDFQAAAKAIAATPEYRRDRYGDDGPSARHAYPPLPPGPPLQTSAPADPLSGMGYDAPPSRGSPAEVVEEEEPQDRYHDPRGFWRKFGIGDVGNAERFVRYFGKDVRYVAGQGWVVWCEGRWRRGDAGEIAAKRLGIRVADRIMQVGLREPDEDARKKLYALGATLTNQRAIGPMLSLASAFPEVEASAEDFDRDPYLLGVRNGVVDLRTHELLPPDPGHMITMRAGCDYGPRECPTFLRFVEQIMLGRQDLMRFLTVSLGYSLSGATNTRAFWFLTGSGGNGKGVLTKLVQRILADYSTTLQPESIMVRRNEQIPADLAKLQGKRFVAVPEVNDEKRLNTALIKQLSGFDEVTARFLNQNFIEFIPCAKIWMSGNQRPQVGNFDHALRTRLRVVPFDLDVPVAEQDGDLGDKLWDEAPGILWFLVQAFAEYRRGNLPVVDEVEQATDAYQASTDTVSAFIEEECDVGDPTHRCVRKAIFGRYLSWCRESGVRGMGKQKFYARLEQLGHPTVKQALHGMDVTTGIFLKGGSEE